MGREIGGTEVAQVGVNFDSDTVQAMVEQGVSEIPSVYIRSEEQRCTYKEKFGTNIPVIDLSKEGANLSEDIGNACREWGFFQVVNHGVPLELLERMLQLISEFYLKPVKEKQIYTRTPAKDGQPPSDGYGSRYFQGSATPDWKDYFTHYCLPRSRCNPERWPADPKDYRSTILKYSDETLKLAQRLLGCISESLGEETSYVQESLGEPSQNIVMNYYCPCPQPELALGLTAHSDNGAITILLQNDVPGLQVLNKGEWFTVQPIPGALVVNIGDMLQLLTNNKYTSVLHRGIVHKDKSRQSVATFYNLSQDQAVNPAPRCIDAEHPRLFKEVVFGDHLKAFYTTGSKQGAKWMDKYRLKPLEE